MTLDQFVTRFAEEFDETPAEKFQPSTNYRALEEWSSLVALSIISMVDEEYDKQITGSDLRANTTIEELYHFIESK